MIVNKTTNRTRFKGEPNFDGLLLEAIDLTLSCFGEATKTALYAHLEILFNIKPDEIPNKLEHFSRALETLIGFGAKSLEVLIMKNLQAKLKDAGLSDSCDCVSPQIGFLKYMDFERQRFEESKNNEKEGIFIDETEEQPFCS